MDALPSTADVVIVGGGVIGASVAWHLARRGCRNVVLLERAASPGQGSTGRATGGFRAQFATTVNVELSLLAREALRRLPDDLGIDGGYRPAGYLFVASDERQLEPLRRARAVQRAAGLLETVELSADEVLHRNPALAPPMVAGGMICETDGFIRPLQLLDGFLAAAQRLGVRIVSDCAVQALPRTPSGRLGEVRTSCGTIRAGTVVNAAGAWAASVAAMAGVSLAVRPVHRQVACVAGPSPLSPDMPMTIFVEDGTHCRERGGRLLLLGPGPQRDTANDAAGQLPEPTRCYDHAWARTLLDTMRPRLPLLAGAAVDRNACWAGYYEQSPDGHAILGRAPEAPDMILVNGSSGHGVMHAPALGLLVSELVLDGQIHSLDARALRPERFAEGEPHRVPDLF